MTTVTKKISADVLNFLSKQQLEPTPQNYALGYHHIAGINAGLSKAITNITDDGFRLTQAEANTLCELHNLSGGDVKIVNNSATTESKEVEDAINNVRHQMLKLADITSSQNEATNRFGKDLTDNLERLQGDPEMMALLNTMIERTAAAERDLAKASAEAEKLRNDLEAARSDANVDALTKIPNRRSIDAMLKKLEAAGKERTIAFCDVDKFKRVNDNYGHAVGDRVLQSVAEILKETCEGHGTVARWGGEEFVVVFEEKTPVQAAVIVDLARQKLTEKTFRLRQTDEPLGVMSFSAGVASGTGPTADIAAAADALLYKAKEEGRNRILTQ